MIMSILTGYGMLFVYDWIKQNAAKKIVYCFVLLPIIPLASYYNQADMSRYFFAHDYGMNLLRHLPKKTMLFNQVDYNVFPLWYLQYVENVRLDVPVFSVLFLTRPWYVERMLNLYPDVALTCKPTEAYGQIFSNIINNNADDYQLYFTHDFATQKDANAPMPQEAVKNGILYSLQGKSTGEELTYNYRGVFDSSIYKEVWADEVIGVYGYYYAWLGQEALENNNFSKAINYLKKAMKFDKNNVSYYPNLALAYNSQKKHTEALTILKQGAKIHANKVEIWYHLAMTYYYMQQYDEAISNLQHAISINPNDAATYDLLGICYHFKGQKQQAIDAIKESLRLNPSSQEAMMHLKMIQEQTD
jgi:tetratricopeptide (TPR) repeat protein